MGAGGLLLGGRCAGWAGWPVLTTCFVSDTSTSLSFDELSDSQDSFSEEDPRLNNNFGGINDFNRPRRMFAPASRPARAASEPIPHCSNYSGINRKLTPSGCLDRKNVKFTVVPSGDPVVIL